MFLVRNTQLLSSAHAQPVATPPADPAAPVATDSAGPARTLAAMFSEPVALPPSIPVGADGVVKPLPMTRKARLQRGLNRALLRPLDDLSAGIMRLYLRTKGYHVRKVPTDLGPMAMYEAKGYGTLPPLVLVHGIGGRPTDYYKMLDRLLYNYKKVIMPELPGHGFSKIRDKQLPINSYTFVNAITQGLNQVISPKDPAIIFGHSLGGSFAVSYCLYNPERVRGLILASPTGAPFGKRLEEYRKLYSMRYMHDAASVTEKAFGEKNNFIAHFAWGRLSRPVAQKMVMSDMFTRPITPAELGALRMPVLLLWGAKDRLLPNSHIRYFEKNLPNGTELRRPVGMSHNNPALGPYVVRKELARFANEVVSNAYGLNVRN